MTRILNTITPYAIIGALAFVAGVVVFNVPSIVRALG